MKVGGCSDSNQSLKFEETDENRLETGTLS